MREHSQVTTMNTLRAALRASRHASAVLALPIWLLSPGTLAAQSNQSSPLGTQLYQRHCAPCHGAQGNGRGESAPRLAGPPPLDFTKGVYKFRSTPTGSLPTDADLIRSVRRGLPGTAMPAWDGVLDDAQLAAVVTYIKAFSPRFSHAQAVQVVAIPKRVPTADAASIGRGRGVFLLMKCFLCHGASGGGDGPDARKLKDVYGHPVAARDFSRGELKGGAAPRDVYRTLATGIDGTPMVAYFADPEVLAQTLVRLRDKFSAEVLARSELSSDDRDQLRALVTTLPTEAVYDALSEPQQQALVRSWQWDLVHYIRSVAQRGSWWRRLLGLAP